MESPAKSMRERCWRLGQEMLNEVEHTVLMNLLAKIIVQEKVLDCDAFEMASKAYSEGFYNIPLGEGD
jgi:hypothetical protein